MKTIKYNNYQDIPQFPQAYYRTDVSFDYLEETLKQWDDRENTPLILNPEWQRGHVWTISQQVSFVEYSLKGGTTGREIYFNCSSWQGGYNTPIYCVDGLQRLTAVRAFMSNQIPAFGTLRKDFKGGFRLSHNRFSFNMLMVKNKKDLLKVYLDFNSGGTPHNQKELDRVTKMIEDTDESEIL